MDDETTEVDNRKDNQVGKIKDDEKEREREIRPQ